MPSTRSARTALRRARRSRTLVLAALIPCVIAGLETFFTLLPELRETFGVASYVAVSVAISSVLTYLRSTTHRPLSDYDHDDAPPPMGAAQDEPIDPEDKGA